MKILFIGDVVGSPGRKVLKSTLPQLKSQLGADLTIVNGENSAGGLGITPDTAKEIFGAGADVITTGNHIWGKREIYPYLDAEKRRIVRPINCPEGAPGSGWCTHVTNSVRVLIVNALGRIFMNDGAECPFRSIERLLESEQGNFDVAFVDFHAEATSEKIALGYFLAGKATAVVGTHTHVQTADERILRGHTAFISDVGMCGPYESVIGVDPENVVRRFYSGLPDRFEVAKKGPSIVCGVIIDCDEKSGKARTIERVQLIE